MILAVVAAVGAGLLTQRSDAGPQTLHPTRAARLGSVTVGGLGGYVLAAEASGDHVWVDSCIELCGAGNTGLDEERLVEIDARSGAVIRRLPPLANVEAWTLAGSSIWVAHLLSGEITRLDPSSGRVTARLRLRLPTPVAGHDRQFLPDNLSYANGYVWASTARGRLAQIDARTGALVRMLRTPSQDNSTAIDRHGTWVAEELDGIGLLPPGAGRLRIHAIMQAGLPLDVYDVFAGGGVVWALATPDTLETSINGRANTIVLRIDPRTGRVTHRVRVPTSTSGAAVAGGALYLANLARGRIYRVSRAGSLATFRTARRPGWLAAASRGALWAAGGVTRQHRRGWLIRISLPRG